MFKIKKFNKYEWIYLTFAFDSLLKINVGNFKLHFGILLIILIFPLIIFKNSKLLNIKSFFFKNWTIFLFLSYLSIHILFNYDYPGISITLTYYLLAISIFYFIYIKESFISNTAILTFQWILLLTGLFQFFLFKFFGYQLSFIGAEHYISNASYATRLRGFFVEPNWYSITLSFNILLLVMKLNNNIFKHKIMIFVTLVVLLLNASYTFLGVVTLSIFIRFLMDFPRVSKKRFFILFIIIFILTTTFYTRSYSKIKQSQVTGDNTTLINYGSRLLPIINTTLFISKENELIQLFGFGIGSWPYVGLQEHSLGYIGMKREYSIKPAKRDSAEYQVFLLELGYIGLLLFIFDYLYHYWKYRRLNFIYSIATAFMLVSFFIYPIFKFTMYLVPYFIIRANALKERK